MDNINLNSSVQLGNTELLNRERNKENNTQREVPSNTNQAANLDRVTLSLRSVDPTARVESALVYNRNTSIAAPQNFNNLLESRASNKQGDASLVTQSSFTRIINSFDTRVLETRSSPALQAFEQIAENNEDFRFVDTFV